MTSSGLNIKVVNKSRLGFILLITLFRYRARIWLRANKRR